MLRVRLDEVFHLHLLKLARAQNEIARRDLVAKRLTDLRDPKRYLAPHRRLHVQEVYKDPLRSFRTQVSKRERIVFFSRGADRRAKLHVEETRLGKIRGAAV